MTLSLERLGDGWARDEGRSGWGPPGIYDGAQLPRARQSQTDFFALDSVEVRGEADFSTHRRFEILVITNGDGILEVSGQGSKQSLLRGETWLLPAAMGDYRIASTGESISFVSLTDGYRR